VSATKAVCHPRDNHGHSDSSKAANRYKQRVTTRRASISSALVASPRYDEMIAEIAK
jgi:hypothetical protein